MVTTKTTVNKNLLGDMNTTGNEVNSGNGAEIAAILVTALSSLLIDPATPTNNNKVKFKKHMRKSWKFLNVRLNVAMLKKDISTVVVTRQAVIKLFQILLDTDKTAMLAKYTEAMEQVKEEAIEKTADLPLTIRGLKRYAHKLKPVRVGGGMT